MLSLYCVCQINVKTMIPLFSIHLNVFDTQYKDIYKKSWQSTVIVIDCENW